MAYLEQMKIIHKDLAARNVMLTEFKRAKVGDFGLSKPDDDDDGSDQFPLNWSAPEVVINRKPVLKSDVWSFGKRNNYLLFWFTNIQCQALRCGKYFHLATNHLEALEREL